MIAAELSVKFQNRTTISTPKHAVLSYENVYYWIGQQRPAPCLNMNVKIVIPRIKIPFIDIRLLRNQLIFQNESLHTAKTGFLS